MDTKLDTVSQPIALGASEIDRCLTEERLYAQTDPSKIIETIRERLDTSLATPTSNVIQDYKVDLDADKWPEGRRPWEHPVVQALYGYPGKLADLEQQRLRLQSGSGGIVKVSEIDQTEERLLQALRAGNSRSVIVSKDDSTIRVIRNVLLDALSAGKSVLVISNNSKSLEETRSAMQKIGLGDLVLNVSQGIDYKEVLADLSNVAQLGRPVQSPELIETRRVRESAQKKLDSHVKLLTEAIGDTGFSAYEAISSLISLSEQGQVQSPFEFSKMRGWDRAKYESALNLCRTLQQFVEEHGLPRLNPFFGARIDSSDPSAQDQVRGKLESLIKNGKSLDQKLSALFGALRLTADLPEQELLATIRAVIKIDDFFSGDGALLKEVDFKNSKWKLVAGDIEQVYASAKRCIDIRNEYKQLFKPSAWNLDSDRLQAIRDVLDSDGRKGWFTHTFSGELGKAQREFWSLFRSEELIPTELEQQLKVLDLLLEAQSHRRLVKEFSPIWNELLGRNLNPTDSEKLSDWAKARAVGRFVSGLVSTLSSSQQFEWIGTLVKSPLNVHRYSDEIRELEKCLSEFIDSRERLVATLKLDQKQLSNKLSHRSFAEECDLYEAWYHNLDQLKALMKFNDLRRAASSASQDFIVDHIEQAERAELSLPTAFQLSWFSGLVSDFISFRPLAAGFSRQLSEEAIATITEADRKLMRNSNVDIATRHWDDLPEKLVLKGGSIEELIAASADSLYRLKPIVVCSPQDVVRKISSGSKPFDLVIIDQADQLDSVPAISAITRGTQTMLLSQANSGTAVGGSIFDLAQSAGFPMLTIEQGKKTEYSVNRRAGRETYDPFLVSVKRELEKRGYQVDAGIGPKGGILDLAVVHPIDPNRYILALLSDGPNYQSQHSSSGRDLNQPKLLMQQGWNLHRLWVLDWLKNPKLEIEMIESAIKRAIVKENTTFRGKRNRGAEVDPIIAIERESPTNNPIDNSAPIEFDSPIGSVHGGLRVYFSDFHDQTKWKEGLVRLLSTEGPLKAEALAKRILEENGTKNMTREMIATLREAITGLEEAGKIHVSGGVFEVAGESINRATSP